MGIMHTDIPSLRQHDSQEKDHQENGSPDPSIGSVWRQFVQVGLVLL
jgi:hypothetical protein